MSRANELAMLQRTKRVRPEDIDLPMPGAVDMSMDSSMVEMAGYYDYYGTDGGAGGVMDDGYAAYTNGGGATNGMESAMASNATTEADPLKERALKRKKFLAAQLNFSKKVCFIFVSSYIPIIFLKQSRENSEFWVEKIVRNFWFLTI